MLNVVKERDAGHWYGTVKVAVGDGTVDWTGSLSSRGREARRGEPRQSTVISDESSATVIDHVHVQGMTIRRKDEDCIQTSAHPQ